MLAPNFQRYDSTGERVDIWYKNRVDFDMLDIYQKSHYRRYEYALTVIKSNELCGDFACGTGYGSVMLAKKAQKVVGADINNEVITAIKERYKKVNNVEFINDDLLNISFNNEFDNVISFETIEHFPEDKILSLLQNFNKSLKSKGKLIISTPYMQERDAAALKLGHHLTFYINEEKINNWFSATGFEPLDFKYQNYETHGIKGDLEKKDFIICIAQKR
jgi:2-polyprenyl-3-methyl-5-hydroxy-6-metoxy-1,4-benzoquinol methylase